MDKQIFSLDIGTRSVTGVILERRNDEFILVDSYSEEHQVRSMQDGQIHHVIDVANVITNVTNKLEGRNGELKRVSIAAAGRSLKTMQSSAMIKINGQPIIDGEVIKHLELSAVQNAQASLINNIKSGGSSNYYCVGYSVLHYELDGVNIGSLVDQKGEQASVAVIATFLPKMVIESLFSALKRADLEMNTLTLEPIAAINALVPESMRKINIALVDIGAGTSDIAITNYGTVIAYGMVPSAGDEITETISQHFLLDFPIAEKIKKDIVNQGHAKIKNILGFETEINYQELTSAIQNQVESLSQAIAKEVLNLNQKTPQAVMLIGGGSLTPELAINLSESLGLPSTRVAVRDIDAISQIKKTSALPSGPDFVTPIGIAIAAHQKPIHYLTVQVNDKPLSMFQLKELTIGDVLIHASIDISQFYGKPGIAYFVHVNGKEITIPGTYGQGPKLELNNQQASIENSVHNNDAIYLVKGSDGHSPHVTINELLEDIPSLTFFLNNERRTIKSSIIVNKEKESKDYLINDRDKIQIKEVKTIKDILSLYSSDKLPVSDGFFIYVNSKALKLVAGETQLILNKREVTYDTSIKNNDRLIVKPSKEPTLNDLLKQLGLHYWKIIKVTFNKVPVQLKQPCLKVLRDQTSLTENSKLFRNEHLKLTELESPSFIFQDIFRYVDLDLSQMKGNFKLLINNNPSGFDDEIKDDDILNINCD